MSELKESKEKRWWQKDIGLSGWYLVGAVLGAGALFEFLPVIFFIILIILLFASLIWVLTKIKNW